MNVMVEVPPALAGVDPCCWDQVVFPAPAADVAGEWYSLDQTFVMEPGLAKLPRAPIQ